VQIGPGGSPKQIQGLGEQSLRLSGKPAEDVQPYTDPRILLRDAFEEALNQPGVVGAPHLLQDRRRSALHSQMQVPTEKRLPQQFE